MVEVIQQGVYLLNGTEIKKDNAGMPTPDEARENTITYGILRAHDVDGSKGNKMRIRFDAMASHDITYVGIIQTARASGLEKFPIPYAMTNCHNSLCAVGGTINEDDHVFGLSAAKKYGGIYVPANQAVIHQYVREEMAKCGNMILGSDSHTRYGSLGNMGVGEGGGEPGPRRGASRRSSVSNPSGAGAGSGRCPRQSTGRGRTRVFRRTSPAPGPRSCLRPPPWTGPPSGRRRGCLPG